LAVDVQDADPESMLKATRRILALRRAHPALKLGDMTVLTTEPLLVFSREGGGEALLAVFNLGHEPQAWAPPKGYIVIDAAYNGEAGTLPPLGGVLLRKQAF